MAEARKLVSLAEPVGFLFLFLRIVLTWLVAGAGALRKLSSLAPSSKAAPRTQPAAGLLELRREDVETVLSRLGLGGGGGGGGESCWSADEFEALFEEKEPSLEEVKQAFRVFDDDGDGFIGAAELRRVLVGLGLPEAAEIDACRRMIDSWDENGDGKIDFAEFVRFMESGFC